MKIIIVVANLGHLKVYRIVQTPVRGPKLEFVEEMEFPEGHGHYVDKVTDMAGRFPVDEGVGASVQMGAAEASKAELEIGHRLTKLVAEQIEAILRKERPERWDFAATSEIQQAILDKISPEIRERLLRVVHADLTKLPPDDVLAHFIPAQTRT